MDDRGAVDKTAGIVAVVAGRSRQAGTSGIQRDSEWEPTGALHHLGVRFDCPSGGREAKASR